MGDLMHEKITQFFFYLGLLALLWRGRGRGRGSCWCGCGWHAFRSGQFWFEPHVWEHLTDSFLYLRIKIAVSYIMKREMKSATAKFTKAFSSKIQADSFLPLRRNHPCINSWARIAPVSSLHPTSYQKTRSLQGMVKLANFQQRTKKW